MRSVLVAPTAGLAVFAVASFFGLTLAFQVAYLAMVVVLFIQLNLRVTAENTP